MCPKGCDGMNEDEILFSKVSDGISNLIGDLGFDINVAAPEYAKLADAICMIADELIEVRYLYPELVSLPTGS